MKNKIILVCGDCESRNYRCQLSSEKNLNLKKYCPFCRKSVVHYGNK